MVGGEVRICNAHGIHHSVCVDVLPITLVSDVVLKDRCLHIQAYKTNSVDGATLHSCALSESCVCYRAI